MSETHNPSQIPPSDAIEPDKSLHATSENWFEYPIRAYPHHTDYAGIVWHGAYQKITGLKPRPLGRSVL